MFKSIRWSNQFWHASLLALVLVGFSLGTFGGIMQMRYKEIKSELERDVQMLAAAYPDLPPRGAPGEGRRPGGILDLRSIFSRGPLTTSPSDQDRGRMPFGGWRGGRPPISEIQIPPSLVTRFQDREPGSLYYVFFALDDTIAKSSSAAPASISPVPLPPQDSGPPQPQPAQFRQRGDLLEAYTYGQFGSRVLVGRSIIREKAELHRLAILLAGVGGGILVIGLAGGWVVSGRIVRPIHAIATTAKDISATNLSRRIDSAGTKSELGELASVLNSMFSRLEAAFAQQVRLTADASHELRTPLSVIHTHMQLALSRPRSAEEYRNTIATCLRASTRMKDLVDSLLFLAGADSGKLTINRQLCDLRGVTEDCQTMVSTLAAERKITIESDLQDVQLSADASRISQVIINLLTNAVRYNREGGSIKVALRVEGGDAVLRIADTGPGIPSEHQPHIFERFYRVDKARSRDAGGSGLGLAICKTIVDAHGGSIEFISEETKGTTFTIRLPNATATSGIPAAGLDSQ